MPFFGGDPFGDFATHDPFGDVHRHMRRQMAEMDRMMGGMLDPFGMFGFGGGQRFGAIEDGRSQGRSDARGQMVDDNDPRHRQLAPFRDDMMMMPFGGGLFGGGLFGGMMRQMDDLHRRAAEDPNAHVYSHSTVISYDGTGEQPRYYEATNSMRKSGEAKEVRKTVRNSATGEDKMSISHTLGDRTHEIEKKRGRDGRIREEQRFTNLEQNQAEDFDREFSSRTRRYGYGGGRRQIASGSGGRSSARAAIERQPIVTIPDDDDDVPAGPSSSTRQANYSRSGTGPKIEEI